MTEEKSKFIRNVLPHPPFGTRLVYCRANGEFVGEIVVQTQGWALACDLLDDARSLAREQLFATPDLQKRKAS